MNKSSSSASTTPIHDSNNPLTPPTTDASATTSASVTCLTSARKRQPSIIPLDYNYRTMTPSTSYSQEQATQLRRNTTDTPSNLYHSRPLPVLLERSISVETSTSNGAGDYNSLFGDPVPPPPPVIPDILSPPPPRPNSESQSSEEDGFGQTYTRLFPTTPYTRHQFHQHHHHHHHHPPLQQHHQHQHHVTRNFEVLLPTPVPRLQPPDIQILPNSSGGSGSGGSETRDDTCPNFALLTPENIIRKPTLFNMSEEADIVELTETVTISDANGAREYTEATRRVSNFAEDFKSNVGSLSTSITPTQPCAASRKYSEDSYASSDWFHPFMGSVDYPEFNKMPRLRPSSRNVMSIKSDQMSMRNSPVATMLQDAQGSSSGEETQQQHLNVTQTLSQPSVSLDALTSQSSPSPPVEPTPPPRPPEPTPRNLRAFDRDLDRELAYVTITPKQRRRRTSSESDFVTPPPPPQPPPLIEASNESAFEEEDVGEKEDFEVAEVFKREKSPVILRDSIATGSDYRVEEPRLHKKTAFTIISTRSPLSSRATSTSPMQTQQQPLQPPTSTTSSSSPAKPVAKPRYHLHRKSLTTMQLKLPTLQPIPLRGMDGTDSPRPSVQFNMTGQHTPSPMPQKSILHNRDSLTSSQDTLPLRTTPTPTMSPYNDNSLNMVRVKSYETLPLITDPYRTAIPRLQRAKTDLYREPVVVPPGALPRPLKPNPNPTRQQRGLLRVINGEEITSRIPQRSHWSGSMDDLVTRRPKHLTPLTKGLVVGTASRRRSSSTSPERRSSTQTMSDRRSSNLSSITTSDFSFRQPPITMQRRQSLLPPTTQQRRRQSLAPLPSKPKQQPVLDGRRTPRTKIARPSPLSPIIGTPNKDSSTPTSPLHSHIGGTIAPPSETASEATSRRNSINSSRIPVLNGTSSVLEMRLGSRANSPLKEFAAQLPLSSGPTSRATSSRTQSQMTSRAPSRSTSRASTRPVSRGAGGGGGMTAGPSSRSTSRSNSRLDRPKAPIQNTKGRPGSVSPNAGRRRHETQTELSRRQSISLSPRAMRRSGSRLHLSRDAHAAATAAAAAVVSGQRQRVGRSKTPILERRGSQSRIPMRARSASRASPASRKMRTPSPPKKAATTAMSPASRKKQLLQTPTPKRATPTVRKSTGKPTASTKKTTPSSTRKADSSVRRTTSSVTKQMAAAKKQPGGLQRSGSNLKREGSNHQLQQQQRLGTAGGAVKSIKREVSSLSMKKMPVTADGKRGATKPVVSDKKTPAKVTTAKSGDKAKAATTVDGVPMAATTVASGTASGMAAGSRVGTSDSSAADNEKPSTSASSTDGVGGNSGSGSSGARGVAVLKRQASSMSLLRMGSKLSLLNKKRSDSGLSKRSIAEQPVAEAQQTEVDGGLSDQEMSTLPAAILEKSQKTLETIQKTVTVATDEIQKTINENLTDLKSLEQDMGKISDTAVSPSSSVATVVENRAATTLSRPPTINGTDTSSVSRTGTAGEQAQKTSQASAITPMQPIEAAVAVVNSGTVAKDAAAAPTGTEERVSDAQDASRKISVLPDVECESANLQNYALDVEGGGVATADILNADAKTTANVIGSSDDANKRRSPDGQGSATLDGGDGGGEKTDSSEFLEAKQKSEGDITDDDTTSTRGCCSCCARFCIPCRRARCSTCCQRRRREHHADGDEARRPVLSATSSATTTHLEVIDETQSTHQQGKPSCWQRLNCCKRCRKQKTPSTAAPLETSNMEAAATTTTAAPTMSHGPTSKQSKCGLCLSKVFCCRSVNKIEAVTGVETEVRKCCFCIPCRRRNRNSISGGQASRAWQDVEAGITPTDASVLEGVEGTRDTTDRPGCCRRFWRRVCCCCVKKTPPPGLESRRASIKAPPPPEDTRRKLHVDLVEYTSKMKGAIPVLPLYLAWFCMLCNILVPGLGTIFSGLFCLCLGIPRFSQYDSAKARIGSFIINIIVGVSQFFCVLFCCVGWGWSIWWGTIMLKCARKLSKIKKVERLEMEEERRQAEAAAAATVAAARIAHGNEGEASATISVATAATATATAVATTIAATAATTPTTKA